jgi:hypothetical protein
MTRKSKNIATFGSVAALVAATVFVPSVAATAAPTDCEPGYVDTTFSSSSSNAEPVGSFTGTNPAGAPIQQTFTVSTSTTRTYELTGSVSFESVLAPLKAEVSATAASSVTWEAGTTIGPIEIPAGGSVDVIYGYNTVSFSGSQRTCQSNGQYGAATTFSGVAPTGAYTSA